MPGPMNKTLGLILILLLAISGCGTSGNQSGAGIQAPVNIAVTPSNFPKQVKLTWNPAIDAVKYNVYYSPNPGVTKANATRATPAYSPFTLNVPFGVNTLYFAVSSTDYLSNESALSAEVQATLIDVSPLNLSAVVRTSRSS